jgi:hypothetical protein
MKNLPLICLLLIFFQSCSITENADLSSLTLEEELRQIMSQPLDFPSGKLSQVVVYGGNSESVFSTREIYYPNSGNITYHVVRDQKQDTVAIGLNYFSVDDRVETSVNFTYINNKPIWQSTREFNYNSEKLLEKIFITTSTESRRLLSNHQYDTQNKLIQIEYPFANGVEMEVFEYDDQGRIYSSWKTVKGQEEARMDYMVYRYTNGFLEAKESNGLGQNSTEWKDAFQYFYDTKGRLILQNEFDPYFGFQQKGRSEFFYHD